MPTGYTCKIEEGCTFAEYAWACARAFGACVTMRDDPPDAPIPEKFEPGDWYEKRVAEAEAALSRLRAMTASDVARAAAEEREEAVADNARYAEEHRRKAALYDAMRARVEAWDPPTTDHEGMKHFMLEQIRISTDDAPYRRPLPPDDPDAWRAAREASLRRDLADARKHHEEEVERTRGRNEWIARLRASVPQPPRGKDGGR